jgi:protoporphyrinogen oxidase/glycosyltransferase involved in cell wall biosynthesis
MKKIISGSFSLTPTSRGMFPKIAVCIVNFCGVSTRTCGAGVYTINQLAAIDQHNVQAMGRDIIPFLFTPNYASDLLDPDGRSLIKPDVLQTNQSLCKKWGGSVTLVPSADGSSYPAFWDESRWDEQVDLTLQEIIKTIKGLPEDVKDVHVIVNDILYAPLPAKLLERKSEWGSINIKAMWIPHSTSLSFSNGGHNVVANSNTEREQRERVAIQQASTWGYSIGAIGEYFQKHLITDYQAVPAQVVTLKSGIFREKYLSQASELEIENALRERNIPLGKRYIFDIGQGLSHKGHDLAIRAFATLLEQYPQMAASLHLVVLAPDRGAQDVDHTVRMLELIKRLEIKEFVTFIYCFDTTLARMMYSCKDTLVTLIPVRESPEDLIPMEARTNPVSAVLVTSDRGSNCYQVKDGSDGFLANINGIDSLSLHDVKEAKKETLLLANSSLVAKLYRAVILSEAERSAIVTAGKNIVACRYDSVSNLAFNTIQFPYSITKYVGCLILGAGITGLSAGHTFKGFGNSDFLIVESDRTAGGLAQSYEQDGFTFDVGGHVVFSHFEIFDQTLHNLVPEESEWKTLVRNAVVFDPGNISVDVGLGKGFTAYPVQNNIFPYGQDIYESILKEVGSERQRSDASSIDFASWLNEKFGPTLCKIFMTPYNKKVWATSLSDMTARWTADRVSEIDAKKLREKTFSQTLDSNWGPNNTFSFPNPTHENRDKYGAGTGSIWRKYAEQIEGNLQLQSRIVSVDPVNKHVRLENGDVIAYKSLISTIPIDQFVGMFENTSLIDGFEEISKASTCLKHASTHVIGLGMKGQPPVFLQDKSWIYFPDNAPFYRITVMSNYSDANVPGPGRTWSLLLEVSESDFKPVPQSVIDDSVAYLVQHGFIVQNSIITTFYKKFDYGYPIPHREPSGEDVYTRTFFLLDTLQRLDIYSAGRFGDYQYSTGNQDHCHSKGIEAAISVLAKSKYGNNSKVVPMTNRDPNFVNALGSMKKVPLDTYNKALRLNQPFRDVV